MQQTSAHLQSCCLPGSVTLKCLPHEKFAQAEIITELICLPLIKISPVCPIKSFPIIGSSPQEKSSPVDNLPMKICPARAIAGRGGFLPVNCLFWRASYNGTPVGREGMSDASSGRRRRLQRVFNQLPAPHPSSEPTALWPCSHPAVARRPSTRSVCWFATDSVD